MPLSDEQRHNVSVRITAMLADEIHGQFLELYAAAVSLTERHPEQVNNEIRNAVTHMARAIAAPSVGAADKEIGSAERHIDRAKRDAIKIAVVKLRDLIDDACADLKMLNGTIAPAFVVRRDEIHKTRKAIVKDEAKGGDVINAYGLLYAEADEFHDELVSELRVAGKRLSKEEYQKISRRRSWSTFGAGAATAIFAAIIARFAWELGKGYFGY